MKIRVRIKARTTFLDDPEIQSIQIPENPVIDVGSFNAEDAFIRGDSPQTISGKNTGILRRLMKVLLELRRIDLRESDLHDLLTRPHAESIPIPDINDLNPELQRKEVCKIYPHPEKAQQGQKNLIGMKHIHSS